MIQSVLELDIYKGLDWHWEVDSLYYTGMNPYNVHRIVIPEPYQAGCLPGSYGEMMPLNDERGLNRCMWLNRTPTSE